MAGRPIDEWVYKIYRGDALELLPLLPRESVDLVVTDPLGIERLPEPLREPGPRPCPAWWVKG